MKQQVNPRAGGSMVWFAIVLAFVHLLVPVLHATAHAVEDADACAHGCPGGDEHAPTPAHGTDCAMCHAALQTFTTFSAPGMGEAVEHPIDLVADVDPRRVVPSPHTLGLGPRGPPAS